MTSHTQQFEGFKSHLSTLLNERFREDLQDRNNTRTLSKLGGGFSKVMDWIDAVQEDGKSSDQVLEEIRREVAHHTSQWEESSRQIPSDDGDSVELRVMREAVAILDLIHETAPCLTTRLEICTHEEFDQLEETVHIIIRETHLLTESSIRDACRRERARLPHYTECQRRLAAYCLQVFEGDQRHALLNLRGAHVVRRIHDHLKGWVEQLQAKVSDPQCSPKDKAYHHVLREFLHRFEHHLLASDGTCHDYREWLKQHRR